MSHIELLRPFLEIDPDISNQQMMAFLAVARKMVYRQDELARDLGMSDARAKIAIAFWEGRGFIQRENGSVTITPEGRGFYQRVMKA